MESDSKEVGGAAATPTAPGSISVVQISTTTVMQRVSHLQRIQHDSVCVSFSAR